MGCRTSSRSTRRFGLGGHPPRYGLPSTPRPWRLEREPDVDHHPAALELTELRVGHRTVLAASGEIDLATAPELRQAVDTVVASGPLDVWLDLSDVTFMDSTGVKVLVDTRTALDGTGRTFAVICPPGPVRRVLHIAGVDQDLPLFTDRASAHAAS